MLGGFLANVGVGDYLRVQDFGDVGDNGDYEVVEIIDDNNLLVREPFKTGNLTNLDFTTYSLPVSTAKDTILAYIEVPPGAVDFDTCMVTYPDALQTLSEDPYRTFPESIPKGTLSGLEVVTGSGALLVTVNHGLAVTGDGVFTEVQADQSDVVSVVLSAAGNHRIDRVVLVRYDNRRLPETEWEILNVTGTEVLVTVTPSKPSDGDVLTALYALDERYWDLKDVVDLGELYVTDALVTCHTAPKSGKEMGRVQVFDRRGKLLSTFSGVLSLPEAVTYCASELVSLQATHTTSTPDGVFRVEMVGHLYLTENLYVPSSVLLSGPARVYGGYSIILGGRSVVGNHVVATWAAAILGAPPDLPAGHNLYRITIDALYQVGTPFTSFRHLKYDPVELYDPITSTLFEGWLYSVTGDWSFEAILPNTYVAANNTGAVRVCHHHNGLRDLKVDGDIEWRHVWDGEVVRTTVTNLYVKQIKRCKGDVFVVDGTAEWETMAANDSDLGFSTGNEYDLNLSGSLNHNVSRGELLSHFNRVFLETPVSATVFVDGQGVGFDSLEVNLTGDSAVFQPIVEFTSLQTWVGQLLVGFGLVNVGATCNTLTIGRLDTEDLDLQVGSSEITILSYELAGTLTHSTAGYVLLLPQLDSRVNQDRNLRLVGGGTVSWTGSVLSWTSNFLIDLPYTTGWNSISTVSSPLTFGVDGDRMVVTLARAAGGITGVVPSIVAKATPLTEGNDTFVVARRVGTDVFFFDGTRLEAGQSSKLGQTPPPDGSVTWEKLATSAKEYETESLLDYSRGGEVDEDPQVAFRNAALVGFLAPVGGMIQYIAAVDLSGVEREDSFVDGVGVRHRVVGVNDALDRIYVHPGANVTVGVVSQWHGSVMRGPCHFRNQGLGAFTWTRDLNTAADGVTQAGAVLNQFQSAGATFTLSGPGAILIVRDAGAPGANGVYKVTSVIDDQNVLVDRDFPAALNNLDYTIKWSQVVWAVPPGLPIPASSTDYQFLFTDSAGEQHRIYGTYTLDKLLFDYDDEIDDSVPTVTTHGGIDVDNNPRGLDLADLSVGIGVRRHYCSGFAPSPEEQSFGVDCSPAVTGRVRTYLDPREKRLRYGVTEGNISALSEDGCVILAEGTGSIVEFTFWGNGAIPLLKGRSTSPTVLDVWVDGYRMQTGVDLRCAGSLTDDFLGRTYQRPPLMQAPSLSAELVPLLPLGVHTLRLSLPIQGAGAGELDLYGFDVMTCGLTGFPIPDIRVNQGSAFVDAKKVDMPDVTGMTFPVLAGWKGGTVVHAMDTFGVVSQFTREVPDRGTLAANATAGNPTLTGVAPSPITAGYKVGDILEIDDGLGVIRRYVTSMTVNTITVDTNLPNTLPCTVKWYGKTWRSQPSQRTVQSRKIHYPIMSLGAGGDATVFTDVVNCLRTKGDLSWVAGDGDTSLVANDVLVDYDVTYPAEYRMRVENSGDGIRIGFFGTGLDVDVFDGSNYVDNTVFPFDVYVDGYNCGSMSLPEVYSGILRVCSDLPMGHHIVSIVPSVIVPGGTDPVFYMTGFTVYHQDFPGYTGSALSVYDVPADASAHLASSVWDPGMGLVRHWPFRECYVQGANVSRLAGTGYREYHALQLTNNDATVYFYFYGGSFVVRGTLGTCTTYLDGSVSAFVWNDLVASNLGWHCIKFDQTGPGVATVIQAIDVGGQAGVAMRPLLDRRIHRNDFSGFGSVENLLRDDSYPARVPSVTGAAGSQVTTLGLAVADTSKIPDCWASVVADHSAVYLAEFQASVTTSVGGGATAYFQMVVDGRFVDATQGGAMAVVFTAAADTRIVHLSAMVDLCAGTHSAGVLFTVAAAGTIDITDRFLRITEVNRIVEVRS